MTHKKNRELRYRNFIANKHLTAAQKAARCVAMKDSGLTVSAIAFHFGISKGRVYALLAKG